MITKRKSFTISAKVWVETGVTIKAASLKEAIELSEDLKELDFIELKDESQYLAGGFHINGVFEEVPR